MRFAYADPPYPGMSKYYRHDPQCAEVDHAELVRRLCEEYPDGWALSTASTTLKQVIAVCPDDARIAAWVKPWCIWKPGIGVSHAWEPVIFRGGRRRTRQQDTVRDWLSCNIWMGSGLKGAKPKEFCYWLFDVLNIQRDDTLDDLFPGTGIVSRCFEEYCGLRSVLNMPLFAESCSDASL